MGIQPFKLVGGIPTPLENDGVEVSWDVDIPNIWKNKKCLKPPTSFKVDHFKKAHRLFSDGHAWWFLTIYSDTLKDWTAYTSLGMWCVQISSL